MDKLYAITAVAGVFGFFAMLLCIDYRIAIRDSDKREEEEKRRKEEEAATQGTIHPEDLYWLRLNHFLQPQNLQEVSNE